MTDYASPPPPRPSPILRAAVETTNPLVRPFGLPQHAGDFLPDNPAPERPFEWVNVPPPPDPAGWRTR